MPSYEGLFILKTLSRPEITTVLKRTATNIYKNNGILFSIENLGTRTLPHIMKAHGKRFREGSYFLLRFDASIPSVAVLRDEYRRDIDVIRSGFVKVVKPDEFDCTLDEELKPPAYRKDVQEMIAARKPYKYAFQPKTGLSYTPFVK